MEIDKEFLLDCICSSIFSTISIIAIIFTLFTESYGDIALFWLSLIIWSVLLIASVTFLLLIIIQHIR